MAEMYNSTSGIGVSGNDSTLDDRPLDEGDLSLQDIYAFWHGYSLAQRAVTVPVDDILSAWWTFSPSEGDAELAGQIDEYLEARFLKERLRTGMIEARLYGGSCLIVSTNDDETTLEDPLGDTIPTIEAFTVADRWEIRPIEYDRRIASPYFKSPLIYNYTPWLPGPNAVTPGPANSDETVAVAARIHASRIIPLVGIYVPHRLAWDYARGFSDSVLRSTRRALIEYAKVRRATAQAVLNFAETIVEDPHFFSRLDTMTNSEINAYQNQTRLMSNFQNERWIPPGASVNRIAMPAGGLSDQVRDVMMFLAADVGIPPQKLFGIEPPGGLTGAGDYIQQNYWENLNNLRLYHYNANMRRIHDLVMMAEDGPTGGKKRPYKLVGGAFKVETDKDRADRVTVELNAAKSAVDMGALHPMEVRATLKKADNPLWQIEDKYDDELANGPGGMEMPDGAGDDIDAKLAALMAGGKPGPGDDGTTRTDSLANLESFHGIPIRVTHLPGMVRQPGWDPLPVAYGEIQCTIAPDGDPVDAYIGPDTDSEMAYIIRQVRPENGNYDEPKVMLGFADDAQAERLYKRSIDNPDRFGDIDECPIAELVDALKSVASIEQWLDALESEPIRMDATHIITVTPDGSDEGHAVPVDVSGGVVTMPDGQKRKLTGKQAKRWAEIRKKIASETKDPAKKAEHENAAEELKQEPKSAATETKETPAIEAKAPESAGAGQATPEKAAQEGAQAGTRVATPKSVVKQNGHTITGEDATKARRESVAKIFGAERSDDDVVTTIGLDVTGADTSITYDENTAEVRIEHPDYKAVRTFRRDGNDLVCSNDEFYLKKKGTGKGTEMFAQQADSLRAAGVARMETYATRFIEENGEKKELNGYYTWARLGYDAKIPSALRDELPDEFDWDKTRNISDLMKTPSGRDWWKAHGETVAMSFDLAPDSFNSKLLNAYRDAKWKTSN